MVARSVSIAVLIAVHNRREKTLQCLEKLMLSTKMAGALIETFIFDDGSTDGTSDAIAQRYPRVRIKRGDGNQFWNRSMHAIFVEARKCRHSHYLWLNDDTLLDPDALATLLNTATEANEQDQTIVVGAIRDPERGTLTYGGGKRANPIKRPFFYRLLEPNGMPQEIDVMNGNVVLIPHSVAEKVGNLDPLFEHGMGDTDYALRARKLGIKILLSPQYVGVCSRNPTAGTFHDKSASLSTRIRYAFSRKGLPLRSWFAICSRHGGAFWPLHFAWGYLRIILGARK